MSSSFIWCKAKEEKKAHTLIDAGYDSSLDGEAYSSIFFQNANNSVRATDEFMEPSSRTATGGPAPSQRASRRSAYKARDLLRQIAEATHQCGDPGMQFDTTINRWHPSKNTARINASNPCSEYMFLDDSACNLASLNLMKFVGPDGAVRRGGVPARRGHDDPGAGDPGGQRQLPDREDREELARLPAARPWLREPWRAVDVVGHALRQRCRP